MTEFDIILQWVIFFGVTVLVFLRGHLTVFHPTSIYLVFHAIVFCLRPTMIYAYEFDRYWNRIGFLPDPEDFTLTNLTSSLALVVFCAVFAVSTPHQSPHSYKFAPLKKRILNHERWAFLPTAAIMLPLGLYSIKAADMSGDRIGGVYIMTGTSGYLNDLQQVIIPTTVLMIIVMRWRWYSFIPYVALMIYRTSQGFSRWTVIVSIMALMMFYCWDKRKNFPPLSIILLAPIMLLGFNQLSHNRQYFKQLLSGGTTEVVESLEIDVTTTAEEEFQAKWDTPDFANYDFLVFIIHVVPKQTFTYTYFTQHLQIFTEPIPRKIWEGKPKGAPIQYFNLNNYGDFTGLTVSIIGDGWMSWGWFGVIMNSIVIAVVLGRCYTVFVRNQNNIYIVAIFIFTNALLIQLYRDGSVVSLAKKMLFLLAPVICWWIMSWLFAKFKVKYHQEYRPIEEWD